MVREEEGKVAVPGGTVYYRSVGEGTGVPLLCLHGGPGMPHDYLEPLAELAERPPGRRVVFYDQLGCGRSERPDDPELWHVDRSVAELIAVREELGLDEIHLLGSSWGGMLALEYALSQPRGLISLVSASGPASARAFFEHCATLRAGLPADVRTVLDRHEADGHFGCPEFVAAVSVFYRRHLCRLDPWPEALERTFDGLGQQVYEMMWGPSEFGPVTGTLGDWDVTDRLQEIAIPTLLTVGRFDECPADHMADVRDAVPGARLLVFDESSHTAFHEERERYLESVASFLAETEADSGDPRR